MELELRLGTVPTLKTKTKCEPPVQRDLLPRTPVQHHSPPHHLGVPWFTHAKVSSDESIKKGEDTKAISSLNSIAMSSICKDFSRVGKSRNRDLENQLNIKEETDGGGGTSLRGSDEEEILRRKKLRLSKEQLAFLEESFKEHHTLNQKQKLVLAKQLSLRPRQVEVWFQNRRARTKLKRTEVDCEYLKRCCETLREENGRLRKELQELKDLDDTNISNPFPATTLILCPSCEHIASSTKSNLKSKINQQSNN